MGITVKVERVSGRMGDVRMYESEVESNSAVLYSRWSSPVPVPGRSRDGVLMLGDSPPSSKGSHSQWIIGWSTRILKTLMLR